MYMECISGECQNRVVEWESVGVQEHFVRQLRVGKSHLRMGGTRRRSEEDVREESRGGKVHPGGALGGSDASAAAKSVRSQH